MLDLNIYKLLSVDFINIVILFVGIIMQGLKPMKIIRITNFNKSIGSTAVQGKMLLVTIIYKKL